MMTSKLIHGNCLKVMADIPDGSIDAIIADLPYGTTQCHWDILIPFEPLWAHYKRVIKPNGAIVLFGSQPFTTDLINSNRKWFKYEWIWEKSPTGFLNAKKMPMKNIEEVSVFYDKLPTYNPQGLVLMEKEKRNHNPKKEKGMIGLSTHNGGRLPDKYFQGKTNYPNQILKFRNDKGLHPTQKPVALFEYLIRTYTNEGETVLDNTAGVMTTAIACLNTNRRYICIERDDKYFALGSQRVQEHIAKMKETAVQLPMLGEP